MTDPLQPAAPAEPTTGPAGAVRTARLDLPWPKPPLSLNDRSHWRTRSRNIREVRNTVHVLAQAERLPRGLDHITVQLHYRPPDRTRRDTDNLVATLKPICDALTAGTKKYPGYGMVPDDIPAHMAKPEPIIHPAGLGRRSGELWLVITWTEKD